MVLDAVYLTSVISPVQAHHEEERGAKSERRAQTSLFCFCFFLMVALHRMRNTGWDVTLTLNEGHLLRLSSSKIQSMRTQKRCLHHQPGESDGEGVEIAALNGAEEGS